MLARTITTTLLLELGMILRTVVAGASLRGEIGTMPEKMPAFPTGSMMPSVTVTLNVFQAKALIQAVQAGVLSPEFRSWNTTEKALLLTAISRLGEAIK